MVEDETKRAEVEDALSMNLAPTCRCIEEVEALPSMVAAGTTVLVNLLGPRRTFVTTYTETKVRGKKLPLLAATFCPFCGVKYAAPTKVAVDG